MNTRHVRMLTVLALSGGALPSAYAATPDDAWSMSIFGGDAVAESGSLRDPGHVSITDLGTLDPALIGNAGTLSLDKLHYNDLFRRRYDTGLEVGYSFNDNLQSFGRLSYDGQTGRSRRIGTLTSAEGAAGARGADRRAGLPGRRSRRSAGTSSARCCSARAGRSPTPARARSPRNSARACCGASRPPRGSSSASGCSYGAT